jgi:hypothetical protein
MSRVWNKVGSSSVEKNDEWIGTSGVVRSSQQRWIAWLKQTIRSASPSFAETIERRKATLDRRNEST